MTSGFADSVAQAVSKVIKPWMEIKKHADREQRAAAARAKEQYFRGRSSRVTIRAAAFAVMPEAYLKASGGGQYPATARQVMYAARPAIQERTETLDDKYFTQTLLPDYIQEHPDETSAWDVVYDARGHLTEPHTGTMIGIGTLEIRQYLSDAEGPVNLDFGEPEINLEIDTKGPKYRYGTLLYIEKEGFIPLLEAAKIPQRYDVAVASSKGLSSTAARQLIENLSSQVQVVVVHDFDKAGFSILGTLQRNTRRYTFDRMPEIIDLGLRLEDIKKWKLQSEAADYYRGSNPTCNLQENGATTEEIEFMRARRVELNAFTSTQFIAWLEGKFQRHNVKKVIPDPVALERAYRRNMMANLYQELFSEHHEEIEARVKKIRVPRNLNPQLSALLKSKPELPWDRALSELSLQGIDGEK
jgi:hypothetical protein